MTADTSLTIDSPVNNKEGTIYTFSYTEASMVPAGGFIDISFPNDIQFDSVQILQLGTCADTYCSMVADRIIRIQTTEQTARNTKITVHIGGIKNSRSFKPSGTFGIITYDTDGVSKIDIGYNQNVATSIASDITDFIVSRDNTTNGAINTYTF